MFVTLVSWWQPAFGEVVLHSKLGRIGKTVARLIARVRVCLCECERERERERESVCVCVFGVLVLIAC